MDTNSSSRFTVVNNDDSNVVHISSSLMRKLSSKHEQSQQPTTSSPNPKQLVGPKMNPNEVQSQYVKQANNDPVYYDSHSYGLRKEYERKLQENQREWLSQFKQLELLNERLFKQNNEKLTSEILQVEVKYPSKYSSCLETPCKANESSLLQCYQDNAKKPLVCAELVKAFANCVDKTKVDIMIQNK